MMLRALQFFEVLPFKAATSFTSHITAAVAYSVVMDLIVCIFSPTVPSSTCGLDSHIWHRVEKDLYLYTSQQRAWLYVALASEEELVAEDLLIMDIRIGEFNPSSDHSWKSRPGGIWMQRSKFSDKIDQVVTEMNVLFGVKAVDSQWQWTFMRSSLQLNAQSKISIAKLSVLRDKVKSRSDAWAALRIKKNDKFKIV